MRVMTVGELKEKMNSDDWSQYCKLCIERDGFDPNDCLPDEEIAIDRFDACRFNV